MLKLIDRFKQTCKLNRDFALGIVNSNSYAKSRPQGNTYQFVIVFKTCTLQQKKMTKTIFAEGKCRFNPTLSFTLYLNRLVIQNETVFFAKIRLPKSWVSPTGKKCINFFVPQRFYENTNLSVSNNFFRFKCIFLVKKMLDLFLEIEPKWLLKKLNLDRIKNAKFWSNAYRAWL